MINVNISDSKGTNVASITDASSLLTTDIGVPPKEYESVVRPVRQYLTIDGTIDGDSDMRKDGSTTNVDFFLTAPSDADRYIDTLSIAIADAGATLNNFGNIGALTNGVEILYQDSALGDVVIADGLVSNFEFLRACAGGVQPVGGAADSYRANNVQGNSEGYLMQLDFSETFNIPWGIRLKRNTTLKLIVRIKDNVTGVDKFDMIAYGFDRIIKDD